MCNILSTGLMQPFRLVVAYVRYAAHGSELDSPVLCCTVVRTPYYAIEAKAAAVSGVKGVDDL